jgi:XTP/dITP diphosphohydrolase
MSKPQPVSGQQPRLFSGGELVLATHNKGKLKEIGALLGARVGKVSSAADYGIEAPAETGTTFLENARIKALAVAKAAGKPALADDSGFCVSALKGAPGVYSADWAEEPGKPRDFAMAMQRVYREMGASADKKAQFSCCLVLAWPDGHAESVEGVVRGEVTWPPRGSGGFGYDPIFMPEGESRTYGEMTSTEKEKSSHRADAFKKLMAKCFR